MEFPVTDRLVYNGDPGSDRLFRPPVDGVVFRGGMLRGIVSIFENVWCGKESGWRGIVFWCGAYLTSTRPIWNGTPRSSLTARYKALEPTPSRVAVCCFSKKAAVVDL